MGGKGEDVPLTSLSGRGDGVGKLGLCPSSRFVTAGEAEAIGEVLEAVRALADRNRLLKLLL